MQSDTPSASIGALLGMPAHNPSMNTVRHNTRWRGGDIVDFCVPVNAHFPPPLLLQQLRQCLPDLLKHYPDYASTHEQHIGTIAGVPAPNVVAANGSTEIITALCRNASGPILTTVPTFGRWTDLPAEWRKPLHTVAHRRERGWQIDVDELINEALWTGSTTLVVCNPNNPTGSAIHATDIERLVRALPHLDAIVIDESFIDFSNVASAQQLALEAGNLIVVKSLGKSLGWHGMRLGYAVTDSRAAVKLRAQMPWWNINGIAAFVLKQLASSSVLRSAYAASFERIAADRRYLRQRLRRLDALVVYPSQANFLYVELPAGVSGRLLREQLLEQHGLYVRECGNKLGSSESFLRLAVLPGPAADRLVDALSTLLPALPALPRLQGHEEQTWN